MIIKATRLQAGRGARVGRRPPKKNKKKFFGYIWGLFATFSSYGAFFLFFSFLWAFSPCRGLFATFHFMVGFFLGLAPPRPLRKFLRAPMIARRVREHAPRKFFLCDRNLVSSGHVLLRFCLKNDKTNDKL